MSMIAQGFRSNVYALTGKWWVMLLRGLAALVVSVVAFSTREQRSSLSSSFSAPTLSSPECSGFSSISGAGGDHWWALLIEGMLGIVAGIVIWSWPVASTLTLVYFFAAWMVVSGIFQVAAGIQLRAAIDNEWLFILGGAISIAFGIWVFRSGVEGALPTGLLVAWYFLFFAVAQIVFAFRLRSLHANTAPLQTTAKPT